jgi:hypothetical protein
MLGVAGRGDATPDRARAVAPGSTVDIKDSTPASRDLLVEALGTPGTTIRLGPDVDIDLTNVGPIIVKRGVTVTSVRAFPSEPEKRAPGRGKPLLPGRAPNANGPRLYTRAHPRGLLQIPCTDDPAVGLNDNVHLSNFRLQGPDKNIESTDDHLQIGIIVDSCVGVEISNMDISGWSWAGIRIVDDPKNFGGGRIDKPEQVVIRGNYIHNNQHEGENGYGIDLALGATALIEENVFDTNRHSIAGNGYSDGYRAERNLVLKGGGYHKLGFHTHVFDMHGTANCGIRGVVNDSAWNCGRAGGLIVINDNAFQYSAENDIKIRGKPQIEAVILRNVFPFSRLEGGTVLSGGIAVTQGKTNITIGKGPNANITGYDSYGKYGICDFDGDGKDDLFLATGATWWFSSSGEFQWTYLKQAKETIDQLKLGYINGDNRCDVLAANGDSWEVSDGGTAAWRPIGRFAVPMSEVVLGRFGPPVSGLGQTSHAFRRAADGQWYVTSLAAPSWTPAQSSSIPLSKLRFADFTGDGITDVLAVQGGHWSISASGTGEWETLNPKLSQSFDSLSIGDLDADGRADIVRFQPSGANALTPSVSWGGRSDWAALPKVTGVAYGAFALLPLHAFVGRFDAIGGADLLVVDGKRNGRFANRAGTMWNSQYPY